MPPHQNTYRPHPTSTYKAKPYQNRGTQFTCSQPHRSNPPHYNRCYKSSAPRPSRNAIKLTQGIGFYAHNCMSRIREIPHEVAMLKEQLASLIKILQNLQPDEEKLYQKPDEDQMDWQFEYTVLIHNREDQDIRG